MNSEDRVFHGRLLVLKIRVCPPVVCDYVRLLDFFMFPSLLLEDADDQLVFDYDGNKSF